MESANLTTPPPPIRPYTSPDAATTCAKKARPTPPSPTDTALLVAFPEVCRRCGISLSHGHSLRASGKLPLTPIRLGKSVRFRTAELAAWIEAGAPPAARWQAMRDAALRKVGAA